MPSGSVLLTDASNYYWFLTNYLEFFHHDFFHKSDPLPSLINSVHAAWMIRTKCIAYFREWFHKSLIKRRVPDPYITHTTNFFQQNFPGIWIGIARSNKFRKSVPMFLYTYARSCFSHIVFFLFSEQCFTNQFSKKQAFIFTRTNLFMGSRHFCVFGA